MIYNIQNGGVLREQGVMVAYVKTAHVRLEYAFFSVALNRLVNRLGLVTLFSCAMILLSLG